MEIHKEKPQPRKTRTLRKHSTMLFPSGTQHMVVVSILDRKLFDNFIEESERDKIHFVFGTTTTPRTFGSNPTTVLEMNNLNDVKEWGKKVGYKELSECHSIGEFLTLPVWICKEENDPFANLM